MTPADEHERDRDGDDALAAEYVLGVLQAEERRATARRIETDAAFARLVERWEARLAPLASDYGEIDPPASVKQALDRTLFPAAERRLLPALWRSLTLWRGLAAAAIAALVLAVALPLLRAPVEEPAAQLVASLAADASDVRYVAVYDPERNIVGLSHLSGDRGPGRDFELWLIEGGNPPVSLGVIPAGATVRLEPAADAARGLDQGAAFAISLEPEGGSPTGQPTGPVVASGELRRI